MIKDLVSKSRSYRRFFQEFAIDRQTLVGMVELARLSPTGRNAQPLKFILSNEKEKNAVIFKHLGWAGYLKDWGGPVEGERPAGYIIILGDKEISPTFGIDHGIAAQTMLLGATERGLGGCIIATIQRVSLQQALAIPEKYEILIVLALGKPKENVILDLLGPDGDIKYWREPDGTHHVPKRALEDLIVG
jgi:nitroreductase